MRGCFMYVVVVPHTATTYVCGLGVWLCHVCGFGATHRHHICMWFGCVAVSCMWLSGHTPPPHMYVVWVCGCVMYVVVVPHTATTYVCGLGVWLCHVCGCGATHRHHICMWFGCVAVSCMWLRCHTPPQYMYVVWVCGCCMYVVVERLLRVCDCFMCVA